ncbi:PAS domain-containing protein [Algoriphagus sp. AK58]|uniref:PAS domain-containing protein n=1 Tax=Algoriphagus sp. AK58 TaxID=1406877 RepID=UPI001650293D|nr:PAS domain-containing protein [Algoriphagus sp. AK58]
MNPDKNIELMTSSTNRLLKNMEALTSSGTWELNFQTNTLTWSEGVFLMLGYEPNEFQVNFETGVSVIHPEDRERALAHMNEVLVNNIDYYIKKRLIKKDGRIIHVVSKANLERDEYGKPIYMIGVFQDITEFIKTKKKLKKSKKVTEILIENIDGIFWEADAETFQFTYVSPQVKKITGYSQKEWMSSPSFWMDHIHPEDRDFSVNYFHSETKGLKDHKFDYRFKKKDGTYIWLNNRVNVMHQEGVPLKLAGLMVDISNEKELSATLNDELRLKQNFLKTLPSVFYLFDESGKFLIWNNQLETVSEYSGEEIGQMHPLDFFLGKEKETVHHHIQKVLEHGHSELETKLASKSGKVTPFIFTASKINYQGKTCVFGTGVDISEITASKNLLSESYERFEFLAKATNDAIWDFDVVNNSLFWADGFHSLFGYDLSQTQPSLDLLISLIHPEDRERIVSMITAYFNPKCEQNKWLEEYRFKKADGTYAYVMDKALFIRDINGQVTRVVGSMQDISPRKEYEKSLQKLNEELEAKVKALAISNLELEQFAFVASHDLQEPLRMISSFMGLLKRKYGDKLDEKADQYIQFAIGGAKRMQRIILELLELSRIGRNETDLEVVQTEAFVNEIIEGLALKNRKGKFILDALPEIKTNKALLQHIFLNLISNAVKYAKKDLPLEVKISAEELKDHWKFSVKDNGIGIDKEYFEKIFVIFQRIHKDSEYDGTGIGLSIVKKAVEKLEGEIWVESEIDQGSTFFFTIKKIA